jgi:hypothetical protein
MGLAAAAEPTSVWPSFAASREADAPQGRPGVRAVTVQGSFARVQRGPPHATDLLARCRNGLVDGLERHNALRLASAPHEKGDRARGHVRDSI